MIDLDVAIARWKNAGPLPEESLQFLIELREAALTDQLQDLLWAPFVRSLSADQRSAALMMLEAADEGEAFKLF